MPISSRNSIFKKKKLNKNQKQKLLSVIFNAINLHNIAYTNRDGLHTMGIDNIHTSKCSSPCHPLTLNLLLKRIIRNSPSKV